MAEIICEAELGNFELFRDCLSAPLIDKFTGGGDDKEVKRRKGGKGSVRRTVEVQVDRGNAEDLGEFVDYMATEIFTCLPQELRSLDYYVWSKSAVLQDTYSLPLTSHSIPQILAQLLPSIPESLEAYGLLSQTYTIDLFLLPVLNAYITSLSTAPPPPSQTRSQVDGCEICERDWVPLTYHHLIPRAVHAKVLKRGWHREDQLNNVAWLCRACHTFVHKVQTNEELARDFYTVELLLAREEVEAFARWVGKIRWKSR